MVEAAQIRGAKRIKTDNTNVDEDGDDDELEFTVTIAGVVNSPQKLRTFTQKQCLNESWVKTFFENMEKEMVKEVSKNTTQANFKDYFEKLV